MTDVDLLVTQLDQAYDTRSWHGTNLRGSIRRLSPEDAAWRPGAGRHSIHEIVVHCAYWKYTVVRRLTGAKRGSFPLKGSNWFPRKGADPERWAQDLRLLADCHHRLRDLVASLSSRQLSRLAAGSKPVHWVISGIIAHDLYHTGQVQLIKALMPRARGR